MGASRRWIAWCALGLLVDACSDRCANVAQIIPEPDPTVCDLDGGTCQLASYCVTDAGPTFCAPRKSSGERCTTGRECIYGCQPDGTCTFPACD